MKEMNTKKKARGINIPYCQLQEELLDAIIEEFVLREGTDYGEMSYSLEQKVEQVKNQLINGQAEILFDEESETCTIVMM